MVGSERHIDRSTVHEASGAKWHEQRVAALHLEATGPDCLQDRMVQAALVLVEPNGTVDGGWSRIVDPGVPIPVGAAGVHGINTEIARTQGVKPPMALTGLAEVLDEVAEGGIPLVIFNAPFGWTLLLAEAARHGIEIERVSIIDPLVCDQALDRYRKGKRTLDATARHYGRQLGGAPDARADAVATAAITRTLADRFPDLREHTPPQLHVMQAYWHAEWAGGYAEHLRVRGEDADDVDPGWPLPDRAAHLRDVAEYWLSRDVNRSSDP